MTTLSTIKTASSEHTPSIAVRAEELFKEQLSRLHKENDRLFAWLLIGQWLFAVGLAATLSPLAWEGLNNAIHLHVWIALLLGAIIILPAVLLGFMASGNVVTRHCIAISQILIGALLIHLTGGRIETHFHVFGSLAFLAFYRDWRVLLTATIFVAADHLLRGLFYPESVFGGITNVIPRVLEHAAWVVFENIFLVIGIRRSLSEMRQLSLDQAQLEADKEQERLLGEQIKASQTQLVQSEKMASLGQMVAGLAHEMNTPLGYVQNNLQSLKQVQSDLTVLAQRFQMTQEALLSGKLENLETILVENASYLSKVNPQRLQRANDIFNDALDGLNRMRDLVLDLKNFSRLEEADMKPANINSCIDSALKILHHQIKNTVLLVKNYGPLPDMLCFPAKLNQVILNLVNNAIYACEKRYGNSQKGVITIETRKQGDLAVIKISDNGTGIAPEHLNKIFDPFFTTKEVGKGTGLGLSITYKIVQEHKGNIRVVSKQGEGTTFIIELPIRVETQNTSLFLEAEQASA